MPKHVVSRKRTFRKHTCSELRSMYSPFGCERDREIVESNSDDMSKSNEGVNGLKAGDGKGNAGT